MSSIFDVLPDDERARLEKRRQPEWTEPMKAVLVQQPFSGKEWVFEPKLDGERCLAFRKGSSTRLMSRNKKRIDVGYPEVARAVSVQSCDDMILDGEIVAFKDGAPSFGRLQRRMHVRNPTEALLSGVPVFFYVFDVVHVAGHDVSGLSLRSRKKLLRQIVSFKAPLRSVRHRNETGEAYFEEICAKPGWEGLIAKRGDGPYRHTRSKDWLKLKCSKEQEFVIGGYTDPQGSRTGLGALLVGYYEDRDLRYAGKVGTGFDRETLDRLSKKLSSLSRPTPPFAERGMPRRAAHWVEPKLVAQIGFSEWTGDGRLRHPRFMGLRRDKEPRKVVREG